MVVISDVLVKEVYGCGGDLPEPKLIIDCGAYAGYSTLYFLTKYKNAHVIAVEADKRNFDLCRRNLAPYASRVTLIHAAVWPETISLALRTGEWLGTTREWASKAEPLRSSESSNLKAVGIGSLLRDSGFSRIDVLKMATWSEETIFARHCEEWLPHVRNIVIRLIDKKAEDVFFSALSEYRFFLTRCAGVNACMSIEPGAKRKPRHTGEPSNAVLNGDFEELRAASGQIIEGGWIESSPDPAASWKTVVCDPQFRVSLAVRTGLQHSGENALCVSVNPDLAVPVDSAPYAAVQNSGTVPVSEGEAWQLRARIAALGSREVPDGLVRGAYFFLRIHYDDGTSSDLRAEPLFEVTGDYRDKADLVLIPASPPGRRIAGASIWLYVWLANFGPSELETAADTWNVYFDNVSCTKAPS